MKLAPRDRRAVLLGTIGLLVIVGYAGVVRPLRRAAAQLAGRRDVAARYLERYRGIVAAAPAYLAAADSAQLRLGRLTPETFDGDPPRASNRLLELLDDAAVGNDVRILRAGPVPADSLGEGVLRIGASLECESDLAGLLGFLRTLETAGKLLHVSGLEVSVAGGQRRESEVEVLRTALTVYGFVSTAPVPVQDDSEGKSEDDAETPG